jgi:hypothetical protein
MKDTELYDQLAQHVMDAYNALQQAKKNYDDLIEEITEELGGDEEGTRKLVGEQYVITHAQRTRSAYLDKKKFDELCPEMEKMGLVTRTYKEDKRAVLHAMTNGNDNSEVVAFLRANRITKLNKPTLTVTKKA